MTVHSQDDTPQALDVLIVDDESLARSRLVRMVSALEYPIVGEASNGADALAMIEQHDPAIILLDIEMPGQTGLQLAKKIGGLEHPPAVIFTTAYEQYALEAFSAFAVAYLLKPINKEQLAQALNKAQQLTKAQLTHIGSDGNSGNESVVDSNTAPMQPNKPQHISVSSHRGIDLIPIETVRCFIADSKYITVIGTEGESLMDGTLKQLEQDYSEHFIRVHRNALVAVNSIRGLDRAVEGHYTVKLKEIDYKPVVSRRYATKIKDIISRL